MTTATPTLFLDPTLRPPILDRSSGDSHLTLDGSVTGAWEGLTGERREVACLVCGGTMAPCYGAGTAPVGGRCRDCGSTLS
jgi:hypothetical protein